MNRLFFRTYWLFLAACAAGPHSYSPDAVEVTYALSGWPTNRVDVVASDLRPKELKVGDPVPALKRIFVGALSRPIVNAGEKNWLRINLNELQAKKEGERWKATAVIEAELTDTWGKQLKKVRGAGSFSKADLNGTKTAEQCIDEAYRAAILEALKQLDQEAMP